ncbi:MAG TPA: ABC transporter transmembrane domain-containing protein [Vicinamibacterales bacterium]|nr:ABC transporter transmembrane domain-containing protein [Vicinamibacterales bacterium]
MNPLHRLLAYARPYRGRFIAALAAMVIYAAANAGVTYQIKPLIDGVLKGKLAFAWFAWVVIGGYFLKGIGGYFATFLMTDIGQRVVRDIRNQLFRHMLDQSAAFFARTSTGSLMSRITNDVNQIQQAVSETLGDLLREGLSLVAFAAVLFVMDWQLAMVTVFIAPLAIHPLVRLGKRIRRTTRRSQEELEHLTHVTAEAFTGHRIVKAFGAEAHEEHRFRRAAHQVYRTNLKVTSTLAILPSLMELVGGGATVFLVWYGSRQIASNALTEGEFLLFVVAAFMMYTPIKKLSRVNASLQQAMAASERIFEVLDTHSEVRERPNAAVLNGLRHSIEFQHVAFVYEDRPTKPILRDVSFRVAAGEMVAIVGLSGAGKTTLVNLLPRFYDVTAGAIRVDGVDIRDLTLASLRSKIGIVTQETVLFDETIASNIAYGSSGASAEAIEAAATAAHAHEFIAGLSNKYQTRIGERGQTLSGGQRQRLAIARAILKNAPILILDEATSSLDAESELLVQDALQTLMRNRTSFVIAHRLSTVRRADQIIVLEKGRIVEVGKHDELLARPSSVYSKLYALQAFEGRRPGQIRAHPTIQ